MKGTVKFKDSTGIKFVLILTALLLTICIGEAASRLFYLVRWHGHLYGLTSTAYALRLGWQLIPGAYFDFYINEQGFRHPKAVTLQPEQDTVRIFLVGGSTAFGVNGLYPQIDPPRLSDQDTIDYHLQTILAARLKGIQFEVINAAVSEYRLFQEVTLFHEKLVNFRPNLIIFLDGHNDISFLAGGVAVKDHPNPYWNNRHFIRAERVVNPSIWLGPFYYLDLYLGRVSYFYHGFSTAFQRFQDISFVSKSHSFEATAWGNRAFQISDEEALLNMYEGNLRELDEVLPSYINQVKDLRAIAAERNISIVYALQPEIVVENPSDLTAKELAIQQIAFEQHRDLGTLSWRYLTKRIADEIDTFTDNRFQFVNSVTIAGETSSDAYTDYCHLTSEGNRLVAEKLYPAVVKALKRVDSSNKL